MINSALQNKWNHFYDVVPSQLQKVKQAGRVATAFNTNIDAVVKVSGAKLSELAASTGLNDTNFTDGDTQIKTHQDVVRGALKCFTQGIAEEWLCDDYETFEWLQMNLGYDHLQMGGQGGIVANAMAVLGVDKVYAHTASHTKLQAMQFINADNLLAADSNGKLCKAYDIDREEDTPLIHWIIEFDSGDKVTLGDKEFICPKSNRFIATYDPANMVLLKNDGFLKCLDENGFDYMILSGYHNLTTANNGIERVKETVELIKKWKHLNPQALIHLELASTQDLEVRAAIIEHIAPLVDSIGLNEREALDALQVINAPDYAKFSQEKLSAPLLFEILRQIKETCHTPRIQLHFYGMYLTLQDKKFRLTPEQNKKGMMLAAVIAASKAATGKIDDYNQLLWARGEKVSDKGLEELESLARNLDCPQLKENGICECYGYDIIAIPTILVPKPLTLVGMGDTISSISLISSR